MKATRWSRWIRRRVETVEWLSATTVRRRVSIDLRLRQDVFGDPVVRWDEAPIVYVPIAQMEKERLVAFDLRDEQGASLPLITRRRNSCITAAAMSELTRSLVFAHTQQFGATPPGMTVVDVAVPPEVEARFWWITHSHPDDIAKDDPYESFAPTPQTGLRVPSEWDWTEDADGKWRSDGTAIEWRAFLSGDFNFARFAFDCYRLYFVCVPLRWRRDERRVVKFSYAEFRNEPDTPFVARVKGHAADAKIARFWQQVEDFAEGLPRNEPADWIPAASHERGQRSVGLLRRVARALGISSREIVLLTPGIGHAASYHLQVCAPPGLQIQRAALAIRSPDHQPIPNVPVRSGKSVSRLGLYAPGVPPYYSGEATVHLRAEASLVHRGATLSSLLALAAIVLTWRGQNEIISSKFDRSDAAVALLVIIPGILSVLAAQSTDHPLAGQMVFGLRMLAWVPGLLTVVTAGLLLTDHLTNCAGWILSVSAGVTLVTLAAGWRLAARGRPHPSAVEPPSSPSI